MKTAFSRFHRACSVLVVCCCFATACKSRQTATSEIKVTNSYATTNGPDIVEFETTFASGLAGCTGTIVGSNTILTSAHCVSSQAVPPDDFLRMTFRGKSPAWIDVHPYARSPIDRSTDLAVIAFVDDIAEAEGVRTFRKISRSSPSRGERAWLVGFGRYDHGIDASTGKRAGCNTISAVENGYFTIIGIGAGASRPRPSDQFDCEALKDAARAGENSASSFGDSGGPVVSWDMSWILGVTSGGVPDARDADYLRVDYSSFDKTSTRVWLEGLIGPNCGRDVCASFVFEHR